MPKSKESYSKPPVEGVVTSVEPEYYYKGGSITIKPENDTIIRRARHRVMFPLNDVVYEDPRVGDRVQYRSERFVVSKDADKIDDILEILEILDEGWVSCKIIGCPSLEERHGKGVFALWEADAAPVPHRMTMFPKTPKPGEIYHTAVISRIDLVSREPEDD